ncbi:MAG: hypothetical protein OER21_01035 [Gemmatimonadota bacterium]|nr:hypothetical protein [Gemmatimonadota bacterium]
MRSFLVSAVMVGLLVLAGHPAEAQDLRVAVSFRVNEHVAGTVHYGTYPTHRHGPVVVHPAPVRAVPRGVVIVGHEHGRVAKRLRKLEREHAKYHRQLERERAKAYRKHQSHYAPAGLVVVGYGRDDDRYERYDRYDR